MPKPRAKLKLKKKKSTPDVDDTPAKRSRALKVPRLELPRLKLSRPQLRLPIGSGRIKAHREPHERLARIGGSVIGSAALVIAALYAVAAF